MQSSTHIQANPNAIQPAYPSILDIQAYQIGKPIDELTRELGLTDVVKLASNENPLGCSPKVTLAITQELGGLARYPDGNGYYLKQTISDKTQTDLEQITLGNGSNDILDLIARTFVSSDDAVIYSQYAFVVYQMVTKMQGATGVEVPAKRYGHDLEAMLDGVKNNANAKVVFIANPNNPTGTLLTHDDVRAFASQVDALNKSEHRQVLVVLDEAYIEYSPESNNRALLDEFDNVILVRTFSKAYGLAGLRVGYAISSPAVSEMMNRLRQPFNVNTLAQVAAIASLQDDAFIDTCRTMNEQQRRWLCKQCDVLGLAFVPSSANFVMIEVGDGQAVYQALLEQGVIVRPLVGYGLPNWVRVTVGTPEDNTRLIDTLTDVLETV